MPVTPYHFGPGLALKGLLGERMSFGAFVAANIAIDVEPLYFLLTHQYPVHRFMHTLIGATLAAMAVVVVWAALRYIVQTIHTKCVCSGEAVGEEPIDVSTLDAPPPMFVRMIAPIGATIVGAVLGAYSHLLLDSVMHVDAHILWPISDATPMLNVVSLGTLHDFCMWMFGFGAVLLLLRWKTKKELAAGKKSDSAAD